MGQFISTPPNKLLVISGIKRKVCSGETVFVPFICSSSETLDLKLMTLEVESKNIETSKGVRVNIQSICQIKIDAYHDTDPNNKKLNLNREAIDLACQHFLKKSEADIKLSITDTLRGHQRQILSTLTVEELYKDRTRFSAQVKDLVLHDLKKMGLTILSYTVTSIDDLEGYMKDLGAAEIAFVKRQAHEGKAKNQYMKDQFIYQCMSEQTIHKTNNESKAAQEVAKGKARQEEASRNLNLMMNQFKMELNIENAKARESLRIEEAKQKQVIQKEKAMQQVMESEIMLDYDDFQGKICDERKNGVALADLIVQENQAKGIEIMAKAEAENVRLNGMAEAEVILAKGEAEANAFMLKAAAQSEYGKFAIRSKIIDQIPAIARSIGNPLSHIDNITFVTSDGVEGTNITGDMACVLSKLAPSAETIAGIDVMKIIQNVTGSKSKSVTV